MVSIADRLHSVYAPSIRHKWEIGKEIGGLKEYISRTQFALKQRRGNLMRGGLMPRWPSTGAACGRTSPRQPRPKSPAGLTPTAAAPRGWSTAKQDGAARSSPGVSSSRVVDAADREVAVGTGKGMERRWPSRVEGEEVDFSPASTN